MAKALEVVLTLETYTDGVAIFATTGQPYGRVALELRLQPWQQLGQPASIRVTLTRPDAD